MILPRSRQGFDSPYPLRLFIIRFYSNLRKSIHRKVETEEPGLYLYLLFPITLAFLFVFCVARVISRYIPEVGLWLTPGLRVHHFAWGIFVLAASGYLALIFKGPRATYLIALLHGLGLGLAFDEFGMWLRLSDSIRDRLSYDGIIIILGIFFIIISAKPGFKMLKVLYPFKKRTPEIPQKRP